MDLLDREEGAVPRGGGWFRLRREEVQEVIVYAEPDAPISMPVFYLHPSISADNWHSVLDEAHFCINVWAIKITLFIIY